MKAHLRVASMLALALIAQQAQAAIATVQSPTGDLSVSYYDRTAPQEPGMMTGSVLGGYTPVAKVSGNALMIEFMADNGSRGPGVVALDTLQAATGTQTFSGNVQVPLSFAPGARQSAYSISINATLLSDPSSWALYSAQQNLTAPQFDYTASITGTKADGSIGNLLSFNKSVANVSTENITLSALIPVGTDLSKLRFDFGTTFKKEDLPFVFIKAGANYSGQFIVNSISIQPLAAVPETSTYAMMLLGLGGLACARAHRKA